MLLTAAQRAQAGFQSMGLHLASPGTSMWIMTAPMLLPKDGRPQRARMFRSRIGPNKSFHVGQSGEARAVSARRNKA